MHLKYLTFDTSEPTRIARFWGELVGGDVIVEDDHAVVKTAHGPRLLFLVVPEPKTAKNRCHPDYHTPDLKHEVARAIELGAVETGRFEESSRFVVLHDPDGNEFCIVEDDHPDPQG